MISFQDLLIVSGLNVFMIVTGHILHMRYLDRKLAPKKPVQQGTGGKP